jgi:hypothetical protein
MNNFGAFILGIETWHGADETPLSMVGVLVNNYALAETMRNRV